MANWPYKLYAIMSAEAVAGAKGNRGKLIAQGGHGYVGALEDARFRFCEDYEFYLDPIRNGGFMKGCLIAPEASLLALQNRYWSVCGVALIEDRAHTVYDKPTITCLGLGPIKVELIGDDLKELKAFV
jgi:peptidyl-tRNA hydrolase